MGDQTQNQNPGSGQGSNDPKNPNERAGQRPDQGQSGQGQPGQGPGGQSGDRDRASNPQGHAEQNKQPKPGQPDQQNIDR
jgi:hypothetical protein